MLRVAAMIASLVIALGGGGGLYAAAEGSLPDQPLYAMKMVTEQVRTRLTREPAAAWALAWRHADERAQELAEVAAAGGAVDALQVRYEQQAELALQLGEGLPPEDAEMVRQRERERLEAHYQLLGEEPALTRTRQWIRERVQSANESPAAGEPAQQREGPGYGAPHTAPSVPGPEGPGSPQGGNPWVEGTPTPGSGYGPGPGLTCTPQAAPNGPQGPAAFTPAAGNPWTTGTPTPGSGYGPGSGPEPTCTCTPQAAPGGPQGPGAAPAPGNTRAPTEPAPTAPGMGSGGDAPAPGGAGAGGEATPGGPGGSGGNVGGGGWGAAGGR